jgi:hypothetical protein
MNRTRQGYCVVGWDIDKRNLGYPLRISQQLKEQMRQLDHKLVEGQFKESQGNRGHGRGLEENKSNQKFANRPPWAPRASATGP